MIIMLACSGLSNLVASPYPTSQIDNWDRPIIFTQLLPNLVTGIQNTSLCQKN